MDKKNSARRAPKNGYDFEEKNKYRESVWKNFAENLNPETAKVVFMPSSEGLEIPIALKYGFKEENLIAVDENPAVIATSKWRKDYPKVKYYGNKISVAAKKIYDDGIKINAANLDFCNNLSSEFLNEITEFLKYSFDRNEIILSITMMRGRESHTVNVLADLFIKENKHHFEGVEKRISVVLQYLMNNNFLTSIDLLTTDEYKSGKLKMVYAVFALTSSSLIQDRFKDFIGGKKQEMREILEVEKERAKTMSFSHGFHREGSFIFMIDDDLKKKKFTLKQADKLARDNHKKYIELTRKVKDMQYCFEKKLSVEADRMSKNLVCEMPPLIPSNMGHEAYAVNLIRFNYKEPIRTKSIL